MVTATQQQQQHTPNNNLDWIEANKNHACPICNKNDWCYLGFDGTSLEMAICGRAPVTVDDEWVEFGKSNNDHRTKYRRKLPEKTYTPPQKREWIYKDHAGNQIAKQIRNDYEDGNKKIFRNYWIKGEWVNKIPADRDEKEIKRSIMPLYWEEVTSAIAANDHIFICEGETTADAVRKLGLTATTGFGGKWADHLSDYFVGANVVLCPDTDSTGIKNMDKAANSLKGKAKQIKWLYAYPDRAYIWENAVNQSGNGLDLKDYLEDYPMSADELFNLIELERRKLEIHYSKPEKKQQEARSETEDKPKRLNKKQLLHFIRDHLNLRYNEMTREMELDGEVLEVEPYLYLLDKHDIDCGREAAADMMMFVAKENSYNPVIEYLEKVSAIAPVSINDLATRYFGTDNPLFDVFLKKTLIAAVARMYNPGAQHDAVLILKGDQGLGKTNFFRVLAGDYFDNSFSGNNERDDLLNLHRAWFEEWGEVAKVFRKKEVDDLKHFITKTEDAFREPYGRKTQRYKRKCIIVGGVNDEEFLNDPTGDRRFWVIPLQQKVDLQLLKQERDRIWAGAVQAYKDWLQRGGKEEEAPWWLTDQEDSRNSQNNAQYRSTDEWQETIEDYLSHQDVCTVRELLTEAFGYQVKDIAKRDQMRVTSCLKSMGWKKARRLYQGKRQVVWEATPATPTEGYGKGCGRSETRTQSGDDTPATPATPVEQNSCNKGDGEHNSSPDKTSPKVCQAGMAGMVEDNNTPTVVESEGVAHPSNEVWQGMTGVADKQPDREIDWVRHDGQVFLVNARVGDTLYLRKSGSQKTVKKVHIKDVEIGGYK